jgi:hypothetical protein
LLIAFALAAGGRYLTAERILPILVEDVSATTETAFRKSTSYGFISFTIGIINDEEPCGEEHGVDIVATYIWIPAMRKISDLFLGLAGGTSIAGSGLLSVPRSIASDTRRVAGSPRRVLRRTRIVIGHLDTSSD